MINRSTGILGGTFNPVHNGHLRLALEVLTICELSEVRLIPAHTPPHRQSPAATPEQRLQMLNLAVQQCSNLAVDDRELQRADVSFTVDTLRSLRAEAGQQPLCLIMGMDAFQSLHLWYQWRALLDSAHIIVVRRPGVALHIENPEIAELYKKHRTADLSPLLKQEAGKIFSPDIAQLDISSTRIRELIGAKKDVHYLLPEKVIAFIEQEGLYHRH